MADGMIYVPVTGEMVENSMALASSGGTIEGNYWLRWDVNGIQTISWDTCWKDVDFYNGLPSWWLNNNEMYSNDVIGFKKWLQDTNPANLNEGFDFNNWNGSAEKLRFVLRYFDNFNAGQCFIE